MNIPDPAANLINEAKRSMLRTVAKISGMDVAEHGPVPTYEQIMAHTGNTMPEQTTMMESAKRKEARRKRAKQGRRQRSKNRKRNRSRI